MKGRFHWKAYLAGVLTVSLAAALAIPVLGAGGTLQTWKDVLVGGITIALYGETIQPRDASGNAVDPVIYNGTTYLPVRGIASALGLEVDWDGVTKTVYLGGRPAKHYNWMLTSMKVEPADTAYPDTYIYSHDGRRDGKEWMKYAYRWSYGQEYTNADVYFGCDVPPESIPAGGKVTLEMTYRVVGLQGRKNGDALISVPAAGCSIFCGWGTSRFTGENGEEAFWPGKELTNYLSSDLDESRKFSATMPDSEKQGETMEIRFRCSAGDIVWTYTLAYN